MLRRGDQIHRKWTGKGNLGVSAIEISGNRPSSGISRLPLMFSFGLSQISLSLSLSIQDRDIRINGTILPPNDQHREIRERGIFNCRADERLIDAGCSARLVKKV